MPSFTKICSRLFRLPLCKCTNVPKIEDPFPLPLAPTLPNQRTQTPSFVSTTETEKMTEIVEEDVEDYQAAPSKARYQQENNANEANGRVMNGVHRNHGLLTPHASTGNAFAEEDEPQNIVHVVKRKFEDAIVQAEDQPSKFITYEDIATPLIYPSELPAEESHISFASIGVQTSRSYASSRASGSNVSRSNYFAPSPSDAPPIHPAYRTYSNTDSQTQFQAGSSGSGRKSKQARIYSRIPSPSPSKATRTARQHSPERAYSHDRANANEKRSFITEGEREQQAVLDDLLFLKTERTRLFAELRRIVELEREHINLFWYPGTPVGLEDEAPAITQGRNETAVVNANVDSDSLEYISLTSEEERRVHFEAEQRLKALVQDTEDLARRSEKILDTSSQLEDHPTMSNTTPTNELSETETSGGVPTLSFSFQSARDTGDNKGASTSRQGQQSPYRDPTISSWSFASPERSMGRNSLQVNPSTPTSNGLGPAFTFGEGTSLNGTFSDRASFSNQGKRTLLSMHSVEDELEPPPVRDPNSYFIWFDLETNDAIRPAAQTRILEVAVCITDQNFIRLDNGVSYLVHWPLDVNFIASEMCDKVRLMHEASGLLEAYANTPQEKRLTLAQVENNICRYLKKHDVQPIGRGIMAGAGIAFDRGMVRQHMKVLDKFFGHQIFDTSSVWQLVKRKYNRGQRFQERCAHRALEDIYGSMREAKMFSETVLKAPRDVSWPSHSRSN